MKKYCNNSPPSGDRYLVLATSNENKFFEIRSALGQLGIPLYSLRDFPPLPDAPETGNTFEENARQKAEYYFAHLQKPVLAEDSGLVIPSLDDFPGIHSARIAPTDSERIQLVLHRLQAISDRTAYYACTLVFYDGTEACAVEGRCHGVLIEEPRGEGGFGYDPLFCPNGIPRTFAQMTIKEKTQYSHRGQAIQKMAPFLLKRFSRGMGH